jgi:hypothetical protein
MIEADRVLSTPPLNSSSIQEANPPPVALGESVDSFSRQPGIGQPETTKLASESGKPAKGLSRRLMLGGLAMLPAALPAAVEAAADPIYAAIERHKETAAIWDAAVNVRAHFPDTADPRTDEQQERVDELDNAVDEAWEPCEQASVDLINTAPTTLEGIIAAIAYIRIQMRDDGDYMVHHLLLDTGGDAQETMGWIDAFLDTISDAATDLDRAGKAVRS